jgi:hypothetical protein
LLEVVEVEEKETMYAMVAMQNGGVEKLAVEAEEGEQEDESAVEVEEVAEAEGSEVAKVAEVAEAEGSEVAKAAEVEGSAKVEI